MQKISSILGVILVLLSLFAYFPSVIPDAMSIIGFALGFTAVFLAILTTNNTMVFFCITVIIFLSEMVLFNDLLKLMDEKVQVPLAYKIGVYALTIVVLIVFFSISRWLNNVPNSDT